MSAPKICVAIPNTNLVRHLIASSIPTYCRKRKPVFTATTKPIISTKRFRPRRHPPILRVILTADVNDDHACLLIQFFLLRGFLLVVSPLSFACSTCNVGVVGDNLPCVFVLLSLICFIYVASRILSDYLLCPPPDITFHPRPYVFGFRENGRGDHAGMVSLTVSCCYL